ncbi:MAG: class II fructose-bisphosphate aldolase [Enterocloster bolteae]
MYTDIKTILDDANKNNYAVLAASAFNMELARGLIAAADEMQAPLIILMGQAQMTKHARPELMVPMIKTLAEQTNVPVALILDHGRDWEKLHGLTDRDFPPSWWMPRPMTWRRTLPGLKRQWSCVMYRDWQWRASWVM